MVKIGRKWAENAEKMPWRRRPAERVLREPERAGQLLGRVAEIADVAAPSSANAGVRSAPRCASAPGVPMRKKKPIFQSALREVAEIAKIAKNNFCNF